MPSAAKRKAKNTQNEQRKKMGREKEAFFAHECVKLPFHPSLNCSVVVGLVLLALG
jgi:hypothetical protein